MVSPMATSEMPTAPASSRGRSAASTAGMEGSGKPCGRTPMTETPRAARSRTTERTMATTTATRMPGARGMSRLSPRMMARLSSPMPSAQGFVRPSATPCRKATDSAMSPSASVEKPKSLGSWPIRMTTASPVR